MEYKPYFTMAIPFVILRLSDDADKRFMTDLFVAYRHDMYYTALRIVNDHQAAEDMVQEACEAIIDNIERVRRIRNGSLRAYIVAIVRNKSISFVVKRNRRSKYSFLTEEEDVLSRTGDLDAYDVEMTRMFNTMELKRAVQRLSEREQILLRMKYVDELSSEEMAHVFNLEPGSIRYYLTKVRRKLADILKEDG